MSFRALVTRKTDDDQFASAVETLDDSQLPEGDVTVDVDWAGLNYKDGLCLTNPAAMSKVFPHVAGIDFAGVVRDSNDARYQAGQKVVLTGWRVGETHWGGYSQRARVNADWLVPLPDGLSTRDAMVVGTAGLTAMLAINRLEAAGLMPEQGEVLVTGAAGGVGSIAVAVLAKLGYAVAALSGRPQHAEALKDLGASKIVDRTEFLAEADKPLEAARWAGAIDNVGGKLLAKVLSQVKYDGVVASIGMAGGVDLPATVMPFILRGVTLIGIDSVMRPMPQRLAAWQRIAESFDIAAYGGLVEEIPLEDLPAAAQKILAGEVNGRIIVNTN